ncbi:MAG: hypothetical protein ACPKQO_09725 [Nitrososphaeraceae archaeon]
MEIDNSHQLQLPLVEDNKNIPFVVDVLLKYWGEDLNQNFSKPMTLYESLIFASKKSFNYYIYQGSINDLKKRIDQGIPIIVIFPGIYDIIQHVILISGYNTTEKRILTYVPQPDMEGSIPENKFESEWKQDDCISILLIPNDMTNIVKKDDLKFFNSNKICFEIEKDLKDKNFKQSIDKLNKAIETDRDNAHAWFTLGSIYNELNDLKSIECYNNAIKYNDNYYLAYRGLGNYYLKNQNYLLADKFYSKAISINPERNGPIYKNRAISRLNLNRNQEGKSDLLRYLEKTPNASDKENINKAIDELN